MDEPEFFVDRSLGRLQVPRLLRAAGWRLQTLAEVYGIPADEAVEDVSWLEYAGSRGMPALLKDERIRYRRAERRAFIEHQVTAFVLTNANITAADAASLFVENQDAIQRWCRRPGPLLVAVSGSGLRTIDLGQD